jgi:hypothetical protein
MLQTALILSRTISQVNTEAVAVWIEAFLADRRIRGKSKCAIPRVKLLLLLEAGARAAEIIALD